VLRLTTARSLREIDPAEWSPLASGRGLVVSHAYLSSQEGMEVPVRYLLAHEDGRLVAALPVYVWSGDGHLLQNYDPQVMLTPERLRDPADRPAWFPFGLLGTRSSYRNELLVHPSRRGDERLLAELVAAGLETARDMGAVSTALMFLSVDAIRALLPVLPAGMAVMLTSADTRLTVDWPDFDGYLEWLPRRRRRSARAELRVFGNAGFDLSMARMSECVEEGGPLFAALIRRHGIAMTDEEGRTTLRSQADTLDGHAVAWVCRREGRMVAFAVCYEMDGDLNARLAGFDYEATEGTAAYFTLAYYLPIRYAIERRLRSVTWGPAAYEAKLYRGAWLEPLWSAVVPPEAIAQRWRRATAGWNVGSLRWFRKTYGWRGLELSDEEWTRAGLERTPAEVASGRSIGGD
jgi:uncharacterized protein